MALLEQSAEDDLNALEFCMTDLDHYGQLDVNEDLWNGLQTIQSQINLGTCQLKMSC